MFQIEFKHEYFEVMKKGFLWLLVLYSITVTVVLLKLDTRPIIIGIDSFGTRVVSNDQDPIVKAERVSFVKKFISNLYSYDETTFDDRISMVGDLMSDALWSEKKAEFKSLSDRLKTDTLTQKAIIQDIREIDESHFEADLKVTISSRLRQQQTEIRLRMELSESPRTTSKPYPWEVKNYAETVSN